MRSTTWFLSRLLAAVAGSLATGLLSALALDLFITIPALARHNYGSGADFLVGAIYAAQWGAVVGVALGALPAVCVLCFTKAKTAPWYSLPVLVAGSTAGTVILGLPWGLLPGTTATTVVLVAMLIIGATVGGLISTRYLPTSPNTCKSKLG
jgi:hypothetical protein